MIVAQPKVAINPLVFPDEHKQEHPTEPPQTSRVLILTIMNSLYPITTDIMHAITRPCGFVHRIVIIRKRGVQALVEFDSVISAMRAKASLNGVDIYSACCTIKIDYARNSPLIVFRNDTDTWDYTKEFDSVTGQLKPKPDDQELSIFSKIEHAIPIHIKFANTPTTSETHLPSMADLQQGNWDQATGKSRTKRAMANQKETTSFTFQDYNKYHGDGNSRYEREQQHGTRGEQQHAGGHGDHHREQQTRDSGRDGFRSSSENRAYKQPMGERAFDSARAAEHKRFEHTGLGYDDRRGRDNFGGPGRGGGYVKKPSARDYDELKNGYDEKYTGPLGEVS